MEQGESIVSQDLKEQFNRLRSEFSMFSALFEAQFPALFPQTEPAEELTEAQDWVGRVVANGGTVSAGTEAAVETFVAACKAASIWTKLKRVNLLAGTGLAACAVPLIVGSGSSLDTLTNFVSGDYSESAGLTGNGTTKYVDTGFLANALTANSSHMTVVSSAQSGLNGTHGASVTAAAYFGMYSPFTDGLHYAYQYNQTAGQGRLASTIPTLPSGVVTMSRTSSSSHTIYCHGYSVATNATSGGSLPARAVYIFATNASGTASTLRADTVLGYTLGEGLDATESKALADALHTFNLTLGRGDFVMGRTGASSTLDAPEDIIIDGNYAYVPCRDGAGLSIIDITNPAAPSVLTDYTNAAITEAVGIAKNGDIIYLCSWHNRTLCCIDVSNPASPSLLGSVQVGSVEGGGDPDELRKVVYHNGYCFVTHNFDQKVYAVDVSNPASPSVTSSVSLSFRPFAIVRSGTTAFVTGFPGTTLRAVDISNPASMSLLGSITCPSGVGGMEIVGTKLYACGFSDNKLSVFDISNPSSLTQLGTITSSNFGSPNRVHVSGTKAYLAGSTTDSVVVADVTNDASMVYSKRLTYPSLYRCYDVAVATIGGSEWLFAVGRDSDMFTSLRLS